MDKEKTAETRLRLFAAIDVPESIIDAIEPVRLGFAEAGLRTIAPERVHLTLVFFGLVPFAQVANLRASLESAMVPAEHVLTAVGAGVFHSRRRTRVGWIGIQEPGTDLRKLRQCVVKLCRGFIKEPEDRPFSPHLTLARARHDQRPDEPKVREVLERWRDADFGLWAPTEVVLYSSEAEGGSRSYRPLARFPIPPA